MPSTPTRTDRTGKRAAVIKGALAVFARDGYTRASMDAISTEAAVSTRTVYNHFPDKTALFHAVIQHSAARVAEAQTAIIDRHFFRITDLESNLVEFGIALAQPATDEYALHFALVRQINAEAGHIPTETVEAWLDTGPRRVRRELAERLAVLAERGLLELIDPERAAVHLMHLLSVGEPAYRGTTPSQAEIVDWVTSGVRAFLHGYGR